MIKYIIFLLLAIQSQASVVIHNFETAAFPINFVTSFSIPKFDVSLGSLNRIEFYLTGSFTGASRTENLSPRPVSVTLNNNVRFKQEMVGGPNIFDEYVSRTDTFNAGSWDGSFPPDWTGASGKEFAFFNAVKQTFFLEKDDAASLALFTGIGDIDFFVFANDASTTSISGSNIVASQFENTKKIETLIKYHYTPVPEFEYLGLTFAFGMFIVVGFKTYMTKKQ